MKNGKLHIAPTTTASIYGENFLTSGHVVIPPGTCTWDGGCEKWGSVDEIINPIRSARMDTRLAFAFKFGEIEIRAKMPAGDWLWPALWMLPKSNVYGPIPRSGEIDIAEIRGNLNLIAPWGANVGVEQTASTLHFGPSSEFNGFRTAHAEKNIKPGFNADFHLFKLIWTTTQMQFFIDNSLYLTINAGEHFFIFNAIFVRSYIFVIFLKAVDFGSVDISQILDYRILGLMEQSWLLLIKNFTSL